MVCAGVAMWIYEYRKFDRSGFLPVGPYNSREEAAKAMIDYADRFGAIVRGPKEIDFLEIPVLSLKPAESRH